jgi:predicted ATPase
VLAITRGFSSPEIEQAYVRARYLSEQLGDAPELFRTLNGLMALHLTRAEHDRALELAKETLRLARRTRDPEQLLVAHWLTAVGFHRHGELSRAREHLEEAIGRYDPQDYRDHDYPYSRGEPGLNVFGMASWVLWLLGYPDQALARIREARARARELSDPYSQATIVLYGPGLHLYRGEYQAAREEAEALMALAREHGLSLLAGAGSYLRALALTCLGQLDEGIAGLRAFMDAIRRLGYEGTSSSVTTVLAAGLGEAGRVEEGLAVLTEAEAFVARTGERYQEAEVHRVKGDLLLAHPTPDPAQAEAAFREALEVARRQSAKSFELRAATSLACLLRDQGRGEEARALLHPVYDWFTEGFDTKDLKDARALLEELT